MRTGNGPRPSSTSEPSAAPESSVPTAAAPDWPAAADIEPPDLADEPPPEGETGAPASGMGASTQAHAVRSELARAKEATRRSMDERHRGSAAGAGRPGAAPDGSGAGSAAARHTSGAGVPDEQVSLDDEDVDGGVEMGQVVIERLLGGQVLGEFEG